MQAILAPLVDRHKGRSLLLQGRLDETDESGDSASLSDRPKALDPGQGWTQGAAPCPAGNATRVRPL